MTTDAINDPATRKLDSRLHRYHLQRSNGGDAFAGRKLAAWLRQAQFVRVQTRASCEIYPGATLIADYLAQQLDSNGRDESGAVLRDWAKEPDAMFAQAWFEAIGYRSCTMKSICANIISGASRFCHLSLGALCLLACAAALPAQERPRLLVLTDIGGDPDDQQSMIRLMVYANEFNIESLVATASGIPGELKANITRPDLIREIVLAYGAVRTNLLRHARGWPETGALLECIKSGNPHRGRKNIGDGHDTEGSRWLIERIDAGTPERPLNITIWGGQTDLAQALWRVRHDREAAGLARFVQRFRVFDIGDQDAIAEWMHSEFPGMFYILSQPPPGGDRRQGTYRGMYLGGDESLTSREWIERHVLRTGPLGALYPLKTWTAPNPHACLKEGDTPSWFFFLPLGGNDPKDPSKPGWGGQYRKAPDSWYRDVHSKDADPRETVSRWRPDFQSDFARRMSWCLPDGR